MREGVSLLELLPVLHTVVLYGDLIGLLFNFGLFFKFQNHMPTRKLYVETYSIQLFRSVRDSTAHPKPVRLNDKDSRVSRDVEENILWTQPTKAISGGCLYWMQNKTAHLLNYYHIYSISCTHSNKHPVRSLYAFQQCSMMFHPSIGWLIKLNCNMCREIFNWWHFF